VRGRRKASVGAAAALIIGLLLPAPAQAQSGGDAEAPRYVAVAFDAVVLRPLGLVATIVGVGLVGPAVVVSAPGGRDSIEEAWELFVLVPAKSVFKRPLGQF
jgi:hypothetical protein